MKTKGWAPTLLSSPHPSPWRSNGWGSPCPGGGRGRGGGWYALLSQARVGIREVEHLARVLVEVRVVGQHKVHVGGIASKVNLITAYILHQFCKGPHGDAPAGAVVVLHLVRPEKRLLAGDVPEVPGTPRQRIIVALQQPSADSVRLVLIARALTSTAALSRAVCKSLGVCFGQRGGQWLQHREDLDNHGGCKRGPK